MKSCKLIATIPVLTDMNNVNKVISHPYIYGARWNTGVVSPFDETETLDKLNTQCKLFHKKFWVDVKGRQLRVEEWGHPLYTSIKLNHAIEANRGAKVYLRGEQPLDLISCKGNKIFVNPIPKHAVGAGQSVNIISESLKIHGYLTYQDMRYLETCKNLHINNIMASYVQSTEDIMEIKVHQPNANIVCKIESQKGVQNLNELKGFNLMAARDDLYIELDNPYYMNYALEKIISQDSDAICASKIFTSLEHKEKIDYSDFEDLENMYRLGFRTFMLCDNICNYRFDKAMEGWKTFLNGK